jgi:hypothetical protein
MPHLRLVISSMLDHLLIMMMMEYGRKLPHFKEVLRIYYMVGKGKG